MGRNYQPHTVATLRVVMERDFSAFTLESRDEFLSGLSLVTGCPKDEMWHVRVKSGCVVVELELDEEAVLKLIELYEKRSDATAAGELSDLLDFIKKNNVANITAEMRPRFGVSKKLTGDRALVFVHGWRGDNNSFGKLPAILGKRFACPSFIYEYPTGAWSPSPSIVFIARDFDNWFRNEVQARTVGVIAHSMGGVVVRKFLCSQMIRRDPVGRQIRQITFIASPNNGAVFASIGRHVPFLASCQLHELSPNGGFMFDLNEQWQEWVSSNVPSYAMVRSIVGAADDVVSPSNAQGGDPSAALIAEATHTSIVDVSDDEAPIVKTISRLLEEASFGADDTRPATTPRSPSKTA